MKIESTIERNEVEQITREALPTVAIACGMLGESRRFGSTGSSCRGLFSVSLLSCSAYGPDVAGAPKEAASQ